MAPNPPASVDKNLFPTATGEAANTVKAHEQAKDDAIVFYSGWFCPFVQRVWIALEEKGVPYEYREENPYKKDPEFLKISPKGLVPALLYQGKPINESLVILEFLEEVYPASPLLPKDPYLRARVRLAVDHISKVIVPAFYKLTQAQTKEAQDQARTDYYEALRTFEAGIADGGFWGGDKVTVADIAIIPFIFRAKVVLTRHRAFVASDVGSKFVEWQDRVLSLPSVKRTLSSEDKYDGVYARYLDNTAQSLVAQATRGGTGLP